MLNFHTSAHKTIRTKLKENLLPKIKHLQNLQPPIKITTFTKYPKQMQRPLNIHYLIVGEKATMLSHYNNKQHVISYLSRFVLISMMFFLFFKAYPQGKEANIWCFGANIGFDFNQGSPPAIISTNMNTLQRGCASIADSNGKLLFYGDGYNIWNKDHAYMQNAWGLGAGQNQNVIYVPKPGSDQLYYQFNHHTIQQGYERAVFRYSLIDMNLDGGLGGVVDSVRNIDILDYVTYFVSAIKHENGHDIWVVTHTLHNNNYYSYLVTDEGINDNPVISPAGSIMDDGGGYLKFTSDGKKIAFTSWDEGFFEILDFDNSTGEINGDNIITDQFPGHSFGIEFSADNSKVYIQSWRYVFQYNMNAGSPNQILATKDTIADYTAISSGGALQLAPDGKIYFCEGSDNDFVSVIHYPNKLGTLCEFELDAINVGGYYMWDSFPTFIQSYMNDPTYSTQNNCIGDATTFEITETNGIDSVYWDFNDFPNYPNDTSTLFNPSYTFSNAGTFFVDLTVYSGLLEKTVTQEVIIYPLPEPDLGPDTLFCDTSFNITLNPICDADNYWWSTGQFGIPEIIVSDTGSYWVNVTKDGCSNADTINIGIYPQPQLNETNLIITDADCGQSNGSITGLQVTGTPPLSYYWLNVSGDTISYNLDLLNLSAGSYSLIVAFGNDCSSTIASYLVHDNGNLQIDSVNFTNDHCSHNTATLTIYADAPNPDILTYSIDGVNFLSNGGIFTNLSQGSYEVVIKDTNDCVGNYINNPVVIQNISGVEITTEVVTPENNFSADGSILLEATVSSGDINYSIYNGNNPQINNGLFTGLSAGVYNCKVWDDFGCDTVFQIIVPLNTTILLEAISGFGNSCVGDAAVSPLLLNNFNDVYYFEVKITYDINIVSCDGYINLNPELQDGLQASIIPNLGEVHINWQGQSPLSLEDNTTLMELVFGGLGEGISPVYWEAGPGESNFFNQDMDTIDAVCYVGDVQVYSLPEIQMQPYEEACTGDTIIITPSVTGNNGSVDYLWSGPNGYESQDNELKLSPVNSDQEGTYTLIVEDTMYCHESQSIDINIIPSPEIAFSEYDTLWVDPGYILEAGYGAEIYLWNTGETTETIVVDSTGIYNVKVTSYEGCKSTDEVQILWGGNPFYLPNAFTPDGDGLNDTFAAIPKYDYVKKYHLSIFNRWGQMIFETTDINNSWDGTYQGSPCMIGAYVYRIDYEEFGQQSMDSKVVKGTVMLVR